MSNRRESARDSGGGRRGPATRPSPSDEYYPTQWSDWTESSDHSCWQRYRLRAPGDYEHQYDRVQIATVPRIQPTLDPIRETSAGKYTNQTNYTTSNTILETPLSPDHIRSDNLATTEEPFDPHYKVHGAWEFKYARIFKILWTEPVGNMDASHGRTQSTSERSGKYGEKLFQKVRRFVIMDPRIGHCICLPINTYSGQGVKKRGVHAKDHTIIYTGKNPVIIAGENKQGLTKNPIKMNPQNPRHKLDSASRLNYAKPYTVEYNVKVWFIGEVHPDYLWQLGTDYNNVNPRLEPKGAPPPPLTSHTYIYAGGGVATSQASQNPYAQNAPLPAANRASPAGPQNLTQQPYRANPIPEGYNAAPFRNRADINQQTFPMTLPAHNNPPYQSEGQEPKHEVVLSPSSFDTRTASEHAQNTSTYDSSSATGLEADVSSMSLGGHPPSGRLYGTSPSTTQTRLEPQTRSDISSNSHAIPSGYAGQGSSSTSTTPYQPTSGYNSQNARPIPRCRSCRQDFQPEQNITYCSTCDKNAEKKYCANCVSKGIKGHGGRSHKLKGYGYRPETQPSQTKEQSSLSEQPEPAYSSRPVAIPHSSPRSSSNAFQSQSLDDTADRQHYSFPIGDRHAERSAPEHPQQNSHVGSPPQNYDDQGPEEDIYSPDG